MKRYDPNRAPDARGWLELGEAERIRLVEAYHRSVRVRLSRGARKIHASMHVIVENQLAMNDEPVVRALERLVKEGLSRHNAVHAIGCLVAEQIYDVLQGGEESPDTSRARYYAAVESLTAAAWLARADD